MRQLHIIISGRVQGVFFRDYIRGIAVKSGLNGFVKNLANGTVEVIVQGNEKELQQLIQLCNTGPSAASVDKVDVKYENIKEKFAGFKIIY